MKNNVNVLMTPSLLDVKEYIKQHSGYTLEQKNVITEINLNDDVKVGNINCGCFLFQPFIHKDNAEKRIEDEFIYFFRSEYTCTTDITVNYLSDFSLKYVILLFFENSQQITNSTQEAIHNFDSGKWIIFNTNDIFHQVFVPKNTKIKALSIFFSYQQLYYFMNGNEDNLLHKIISENQSFFKYQAMDNTIKEAFNDSFNKKLNLFIDQIGFQKNLYSLIHTSFSTLEDFFNSKSKKIKLADINSLKNVEELITTNIKDLPNLKNIASGVAMSETKLKTLFKEYYGCSIYNYYLNFKMNKAKKMLIEEKQSVKEVATALGYNNISHFSRLFRRYFGQYPSKI